MGLFRRRTSRATPVGDTTTGFDCIGCGEQHTGVPQSFHVPAPDAWSPDLEGIDGCELGTDTCVVHDEQFFVKGLAQTRVAGLTEPFEWGVWVSVSEADFTAIAKVWKQRGRESTPPIPGALANAIWVYEESTLGLPVLLHTQPRGLRFLVELTGDGHVLGREQREGLHHDTFVQRVSQLLHTD